MKRLITVLAIIGLLALPIAAEPVAAGDVVIQSCSQDKYVMYENPGWYGDALGVCYPVNLPDFRQVAHTQPGICAAFGIKLDDNWNDCVNSVVNEVHNESHRICLYTGVNYTGSRYVLNSNFAISWSGLPFADSLSSAKWDCAL